MEAEEGDEEGLHRKAEEGVDPKGSLILRREALEAQEERQGRGQGPEKKVYQKLNSPAHTGNHATPFKRGGRGNPNVA
ncbi:hypothetical protein TthTMY_15480 [Thermus thermophilus]|nr:hypothetical protein TthTMY_15480 [Thermus thermophilus]